MLDDVLQIYASTAQTAYQSGDFKLSSRFLKSAVSESRRRGSDRDVIASFMENLAETQLRQGKERSALSLLKRALQERNPRGTRYGEHLVRLCYKIADLYFHMRYYHRVEEYLKRGLNEELKNSVNLHQLRRLALVLNVRGKHEEGDAILRFLNNLSLPDAIRRTASGSLESADLNILHQIISKATCSTSHRS